MKKKTKKKIKKKIRKLNKKPKKPKKKRKIKFNKRTKASRKTIRRKKIKRSKLKIKLNLPITGYKKIKIPQFKKQREQLKKLNPRRLIGSILRSIFKVYDDFIKRKKLEKLRKIVHEEKERERKIRQEERLRYEIKQRELRDEIRFAKERSQDLKKFIRKEQAILRREQAEKRRRFLESIKLDKRIEAYRRRELREIKEVEKLALREQREDYRPVEERLEKIKEKYRLIREKKIRARVQSLGVKISDTDTKEDLLNKEKEYAAHRQSIELVLESFYRSANSLVFQLNKRYIPKHKSILRVIDRRYEENLCFIRYDDSSDEDWLVLIYLEDSNPEKETIIVEDKTNSEKYVTKSFRTKDIFTYSDFLVDQFTAHLDREFKKKKAS